jgi:hypothetical protein
MTSPGQLRRQVNETITQALGRGGVPWRSDHGFPKNLIALLDNADEAGREALRRQIKQQMKLFVNKIAVRVEGKPRTKSKRVYCTIYFKNGVERRIWFQKALRTAAFSFRLAGYSCRAYHSFQ